MNQDGAATEIEKLPASLMTANIAAHYKNLATKARNASELFVIDPMTNNMVYDAFLFVFFNVYSLIVTFLNLFDLGKT